MNFFSVGVFLLCIYEQLAMMLMLKKKKKNTLLTGERKKTELYVLTLWRRLSNRVQFDFSWKKKNYEARKKETEKTTKSHKNANESYVCAMQYILCTDEILFNKFFECLKYRHAHVRPKIGSIFIYCGSMYLPSLFFCTLFLANRGHSHYSLHHSNENIEHFCYL